MKMSNSLIKLPQISQSMREMSMEMTKVCSMCYVTYYVIDFHGQAGILEEMMDEIAIDDDDELEEEADEEVDKVLFQLTDGKLGQAGTVSTELPVCLCSSFRVISHFSLII